MPEHNHQDHRCSTKDLYNMEPFFPTPQLGTEEGRRNHTCCLGAEGCDECGKYCSVW